MFLGSLRHCLAGLLRLSGRDSRAQFWPYASTLFLLSMVAMQLCMSRLMSGFAAYAAAHPERSDGFGRTAIHATPPQVLAVMQNILTTVSVIAAIFIALVGAAVVRRLHDRGRTGLWGLLPVVFLATGIFGMGRMFGQVGPAGPNPGIFFLIFVNNLVYLVALVALVVFLAGPGMAGPNEYGPARLPD
jgi:uncharacterized membrane protein YhaH (DUF805 family)